MILARAEYPLIPLGLRKAHEKLRDGAPGKTPPESCPNFAVFSADDAG
jgi:hypothetical protein